MQVRGHDPVLPDRYPEVLLARPAAQAVVPGQVVLGGERARGGALRDLDGDVLAGLEAGDVAAVGRPEVERGDAVGLHLPLHHGELAVSTPATYLKKSSKHIFKKYILKTNL